MRTCSLPRSSTFPGSGFVRVDRDIWTSPETTEHDIVVYVALCSFSYGRSATCFPSIASIAERARISSSTVKRALKHLRELGFIEITHRGAGAARRSNLYGLCSRKFMVGRNALEDHKDPSDPDMGSERSSSGVSAIHELDLNNNIKEESGGPGDLEAAKVYGRIERGWREGRSALETMLEIAAERDRKKPFDFPEIYRQYSRRYRQRTGRRHPDISEEVAKAAERLLTPLGTEEALRLVEEYFSVPGRNCFTISEFAKSLAEEPRAA